MSEGFSEQPVVLDQTRSLVGILTRPNPDTPIQQPAVLILNTGIIHRVGHHRMYVTMARKLAATGRLVLRFDFSGIGDSGRSATGLSLMDARLADVAAARNWLSESCNASEVVIIGLCAGADAALRYGHADKRVVGLVLLDPAIPPTARFYAHYIGRRLLQLRSWLSFVRGHGRIWQDVTAGIKTLFGPTSVTHQARLIDRRSRSKLEQIYVKSLSSGVKLLVVLTGGPLEGRQAYREQLFDAFPKMRFEGNVWLEHFENSDHTFTAPSDRERLNDLLIRWIDSTSFNRTPLPSTESRQIDNSTERDCLAGARKP